jgi:hypothetical protein
MIEDGRSPKSNGGLSFVDIIARLKANRFEIIAGVDYDDVSVFVSPVESLAQAWEREYTNDFFPHHLRIVFLGICPMVPG